MNRNETIEIINKKRIENPFTMKLSLEEYIKSLKRRYLKMNHKILSIDNINIAKLTIWYRKRRTHLIEFFFLFKKFILIWNIKANMLKAMSKELNIERTRLENNLKLRIAY